TTLASDEIPSILEKKKPRQLLTRLRAGLSADLVCVFGNARFVGWEYQVQGFGNYFLKRRCSLSEVSLYAARLGEQYVKNRNEQTHSKSHFTGAAPELGAGRRQSSAAGRHVD